MNFDLHLGWVLPEDRSPQVEKTRRELMEAMPAFQVAGRTANPRFDAERKVLLTDFWKHPYVVQCLGWAFPGWYQNTGSCVGVSWGNAIFSLAVVEVLRLNQPEKVKIPFWPFTYGMSRKDHWRGRGSGSVVSFLAAAAQKYGDFEADLSGLPQFTKKEFQVEYTETEEYTWSDGGAIAQKWIAEAKPHVVKTASPIKSHQEAAEALLNYYPIQTGCSYYCSATQVQDGVCLGSLNSRGGHAVAVLGYYEHPKLGPLFAYANTHPRSMYQVDPAGLPRGACWIDAKAMDYICQSDGGECVAYSQFEGFPAATGISYVP